MGDVKTKRWASMRLLLARTKTMGSVQEKYDLRFRKSPLAENRPLSHAEIWWYREIAISLLRRLKKGCTL